MKKLEIKTKISTIALILMLTISALMASMQSVKAQDQESATPENWIELITQTPSGAYRQTSGQTEYPWTCSPGGNPERTGYSAGPGPSTNHTLWRKDLPTHNWAFGVVDAGKVYMISTDQNALYAIDAYTGVTVWQYNLPLPYPNDTRSNILGPWNNDNWIHLMGNLVFAGFGNMRKTMVVGMESGNLEWISPEAARVGLICPPGTVFEDSYAVYLVAERADPVVTTCYKFTYDEHTRIKKIWDAPYVGNRISYYDGKIYGALHYSNLTICTNATTGEVIWNYTLPNNFGEWDIFYQHPVLGDGRAYFPLVTNRVEALDANTGQFLWEFVSPGDYVTNLAFHDGKLYVTGGNEAKLYCVDAASGEVIWEYQAAAPIDYYNPIIAQDKLYFCGAAAPYEGFPLAGTYAGYMYCIDAKTGELIWRYLTTETAVTLWAADGNLYAETPFHDVWCWGKGPTTTNIEAASTSLTLGQSALISGSVTDMSPFSQQHPEIQSPVVAEVPIVLSYVNAGTWTDFATVNTDSAGTFMYTLTPSSIGAYKVVARFEGNDAYFWSSAQEVVQVSPAPSPAQPITPEPTEAPLITTEIAIIIAVIVAAVVGIVAYWALKKRK